MADKCPGLSWRQHPMKCERGGDTLENLGKVSSTYSTSGDSLWAAGVVEKEGQEEGIL